MKIGIGLPATIPGVKGETILDWARRADEGPFSSLGIIDRLPYPNYEPMVTLAAAAAATRRIRLMTTVLLAPLRNPAVLAKEAASLDALSGGRLTLGLGIGGREEDFRAAEVPFKGRGRWFEGAVEKMKRIWAGDPAVEGTAPIGPAPVQAGGPELLIGGYTPVAIRRVGTLADGFISGGIANPQRAHQLYQIAEAAWKEAARPGKPRFAGGIYVALGPEVAERAGWYLRDYYGSGPMTDGMIQALPLTREAVLDKIKSFADVGVDELILWPTVPDLEQVDRLAEVAGAV